MVPRRTVALVLPPLLLAASALGAARPPEPGAAPEQGRREQRQRKEEPARVPSPRLGSLEDARREALERNVPLVVVAIQEGEEANDRFYDGVYRSAGFMAAVSDAVLLLVNDGDHPERVLKEEGEDGEVLERRVCERFETPACEDHKVNFNRVFQAYNEDGALPTPQMIVLAPSGEVRERFVDLHAVTKLTEAIAKVAAAAGPGLSAEQLAQVKRHLGAARTLQENASWAPAWREWTALLTVASAGAFAEEARKGAEAALGELRAAMEGALETMRAGEVVAGWVALVELGPALAGTPLEKEHQKAVRSAERNKDWREAIEAHQRAVEAEGLWKEIEALLGADEVEKAKRVGERILRRFGDTPAAEKVRREWPDLGEGDQERS